jgi:hypothetical protein
MVEAIQASFGIEKQDALKGSSAMGMSNSDACHRINGRLCSECDLLVAFGHLWATVVI